MKKLLTIMTLALLALGVSACSATSEKTVLTSEQSLVSMAYLSSNFLNFNQETNSQGLAFNLADDDFEVDSELESVSEYVELLKSFMENGAPGFANISEELSDREEYKNKLTVVVAEEVYLLYYNVNSETKEISGIFVINEEEYTITAYSYLDDDDDFYEDDDDDFYEEDDDDDDEDDADDMAFTNLSEETTTVVLNDEYEKKMVLIARNGDNYIEIEYKVEVEDDETETKFEMKTFINGIEKEITIEIKIENDEYKIEIEDGDNSYEFKREIEDGGFKYELEYEVNGVEGEIEIFETTNELGETVYIYKIQEEGRTKEVELDDDDDDEHDFIETGFII